MNDSWMKHDIEFDSRVHWVDRRSLNLSGSTQSDVQPPSALTHQPRMLLLSEFRAHNHWHDAVLDHLPASSFDLKRRP